MTDGATTDNAIGRDGSAPFGPANGSGTAIRVRIKIFCDYGRNHRGWGEWHERTMTPERYEAMLKALTNDPTVLAFECQNSVVQHNPKAKDKPE